jgi:hypothetical protein
MDMISSTIFLAIGVSAVMLVAGLIIMLIFSHKARTEEAGQVGDKIETYLCGEKQPQDQPPIAGETLFWPAINQSLKGAYKILVNRFRTYSVNEWTFYMAIWLAFMLALLILVKVI